MVPCIGSVTNRGHRRVGSRWARLQHGQRTRMIQVRVREQNHLMSGAGCSACNSDQSSVSPVSRMADTPVACP